MGNRVATLDLRRLDSLNASKGERQKSVPRIHLIPFKTIHIKSLI